MLKFFNYFTRLEKAIWIISVSLIVASFFLLPGGDRLSFAASLIGVTSILFNAKGNPVGQALMIVFSVLYGIISFSFAYYGEMITYLGMTAPMALIALIAWLRHPFHGKKSEVEVNRISKRETVFMFALSIAVTILFYFILKLLNNATLLVSTLSVTTSFIASYLTFRRSPYFSLAYASNDVVLICLWVVASFSDTSYISVVVCFAAFLLNDMYAFFNWKKMEKMQSCADSAGSAGRH